MPRTPKSPTLGANRTAVATLLEATACKATRVLWLAQENAELLAARPRAAPCGVRYREALAAHGESFLAERRVATTSDVVVPRRSCFHQEIRMMAFSAQRLRDARTAAGLTPEHVAVATGRSSFSVREWERGRVTPPTPLLGQIAAALSIDVADLFEREGDDAGAVQQQ